jgi:AmmeMemoRadiSam system protein A/AmmeMemoRadiSam system protein B
VGITAFTTPLGDVPLDLAVLAELRDRPGFSGPARAHGPEHSLEVELPFIQLVAPEAKLVPIVIGANTDPVTSIEIAKALSEHLDERTVVIASSDFTHHGRRYGWSPYEDKGDGLGDALLEVGQDTVDLIVAMDARGLRTQVAVSGDTVCGVRPVEVLVHLLSHAFDGAGRVLEVTTSGHLTGSFDLSVTYAAVVFSGDWAPWSEPPAVKAVDLEDADGRELIELARASLQTRLTHDTALAKWYSSHGETDHLLMPAGAFVTLNNNERRAKKDGRLRACMGVIEAEQPLIEAVVQAAVWAAQDPRFPPLELEELDQVSVEVSVLSPARPVKSFRLIEVGKHGVVMSKDGRRSVFLPQVATEQGWDRETMLEQLSAKAGLPRNAWQHGATFEVFTAQVFTEHQ